MEVLNKWGRKGFANLTYESIGRRWPSLRRIYKDPPVMEAVCQIRFTPESEWDSAIPGIVFGKLSDTFPLRKRSKRVQAAVRLSADNAGEVEIVETDQARFLREDETAFIEIGPQNLAIHHLKPYPRWEEFLELIDKGFRSYCDVAQPNNIHRVGLRYVNRIDFDDPVELEEMFRFYPYLHPDLPQDLASFVVGVEFPFEQGRDTLRLKMGSARSEKTTDNTITLDLDYFLSQPRTVKLAEIFSWLNVAHGHVGNVFEGCLTDKLRQRFNIVEEEGELP